MEKQDFKTEKEANQFKGELIHEFVGLNCPVFKKQCLGYRCHSFNGGYIHKFDTDERLEIKEYYKVSKPFCCSPLVSGTIEHEMP